MMPVLAGIHESAVRSEYERKLAQALMLDEGIVREELRHYRPEAEEAPARQPIRQAIAKPDTALRKAGRLVIRMAWQDAAIIAHLETIVPLAGIRDPVQREILTFLKESAEEGRPVDDMSAASLSDEAGAMRQELTMILCGCSARRISMPSTRSTAARRMNMRRTASMRPACRN